MKWLWCLVVGHKKIRVTPTGDVYARPGGILPSIDGFMAFRPDVNGQYQACQRCRKVFDHVRL